jgi:hypothetical protein
MSRASPRRFTARSRFASISDMNRWSTVAVALATLPARAQSRPPAGVDLSGKWTLDTYLSDSPEEIATALRLDFGGGGGGELFGLDPDSGRAGRGGMGRRGQGSPQRGSRPDQASTDEQNRLNDLTAPLRYPPTTLTIAESAEAVVLTDDQGQARTLATTGAKEKQSLGTTPVDTTTRWEGPQLVSEQDLGKGRKVTFTYSIVPTTKQLLIRARIERGAGQSGPLDIKYVYNRAQ